MSAERYRRATVIEADGTREAAVVNADGSRQAAILNAEGEKQAAILKAEGGRQAAILNAEGFALALDRIFQVAQKVDDKTMSLQYLEMMKQLANGSSTKWIIPMELTSFAQSFSRNIASSSARNGALGAPQ